MTRFDQAAEMGRLDAGFSTAPRRHGEPRQSGERSHTCPLHNGSAVIFNGTLADAEVGSDILAGVTRQDQSHDLFLPGRQPSHLRRAAALCQALSLAVS